MKSRICLLLIFFVIVPLLAFGDAHVTRNDCCDDCDCSHCLCCPCGFQPLGIQGEIGLILIPAIPTEQIDWEVWTNLQQDFSLSIDRPPRSLFS